MPSFDFLTFEVADRIATITVNRPDKLNALNDATIAELGVAIDEARMRQDVGGIILTGAGRAFVAGADISELQSQSPFVAKGRARGGQEVFRRFETSPKPVIAAVNGFALGGGLELAMACDLRIAADNAQVGQPEILLGLIPGAGGTQRLPRLVGPSRAKELVWSGRRVRADEAERVGLVDRVVPADELLDRALEWAATFANGAVVAMGLAKRAIDRGLDLPLDEALDVEIDAFVEVFSTEDAGIGVRSFLEHGPGKATFVGR